MWQFAILEVTLIELFILRARTLKATFFPVTLIKHSDLKELGRKD